MTGWQRKRFISVNFHKGCTRCPTKSFKKALYISLLTYDPQGHSLDTIDTYRWLIYDVIYKPNTIALGLVVLEKNFFEKCIF